MTTPEKIEEICELLKVWVFLQKRASSGIYDFEEPVKLVLRARIESLAKSVTGRN